MHTASLQFNKFNLKTFLQRQHFDLEMKKEDTMNISIFQTILPVYLFTIVK